MTHQPMTVHQLINHYLRHYEFVRTEEWPNSVPDAVPQLVMAKCMLEIVLQLQNLNETLLGLGGIIDEIRQGTDMIGGGIHRD